MLKYTQFISLILKKKYVLGTALLGPAVMLILLIFDPPLSKDNCRIFFLVILCSGIKWSGIDERKIEGNNNNNNNNNNGILS